MYKKSKPMSTKNRDALQLCCVCLSRDRTLTVFMEFFPSYKLWKVFQQITDALDLNIVPTSLLCWECIALLKKVYWFKERAKQSQILLSSWDSSKTTLEPLSTLKVAATSTTTSHLPIQEAGVFEEIIIKIETADLNHHDTVDCDVDILGDNFNEIKTDDHRNDVLDDDKNALYGDNEDTDTADETDFDGDIKINMLKEIDEKKSGKNVNNEDFKINTTMDGVGFDHTYSKYDNTKREDPGYKYPRCFKSNIKVGTHIESSRTKKYKVIKNHSMPRYTTKHIHDKYDNTKREDPGYKCPKYFKSNIKVGTQIVSSTKKNYKVIKNLSKARYTTKPITLDEVMALWEKDRDSEYIRSLENKCDLCLIKVKEELAAHKLKVHPERSDKQYCCKVCKSHNDDEKSLTSHMKGHCFKFQCKMCDFETLLCDGIAHHFKNNHAIIVECLKCGVQLKNMTAFRAHFEDLHEKLVCNYCGFHAKRSLEKHIQRKHTPRLCKLCNREFKNDSKYKEHVSLYHTVEKSEATYCVTCNKHFDNMKLFTRHCKSSVVHLEEMGLKKKKVELKCPECPKTYLNKNIMMNHYRFVHLKKSRYCCTICDEQFLNKSNYNKHRRSKHEENYVVKKDKLCNYCGRGFTQKTILISHIRTHTGERPFECSQCDSKFAQKSALATHIRLVHKKIKIGNSETDAAGPSKRKRC